MEQRAIELHLRLTAEKAEEKRRDLACMLQIAEAAARQTAALDALQAGRRLILAGRMDG